eukprot:m.1015019 g.1015019  ORF g.1015019 m.1015019 type:complete len:954 (-) comp24074_c0_seq2:212-3073(-)
MKAIAILSSVPDVVFFTADDDYLDQLERFADDQGMGVQNEDDALASSSAVNMDALQMQYLPIFASLEMLELVESPMHSFETADGHTFVIRQFDDYLYVAIADSEPKEFVLMQLTLLRDLLNMLYGPVTALLRPANAMVRLERWKATSRLMSTVAEQRKREQCYLVQAIEKIRINPFVQRVCREAMEAALSKHRNNTHTANNGGAHTGSPTATGRPWGAHAMLLVGTKLLSLYSHPTAPQLQTCDLFLLGLFVQDVLDRKDAPGLDVTAGDTHPGDDSQFGNPSPSPSSETSGDVGVGDGRGSLTGSATSLGYSDSMRESPYFDATSSLIGDVTESLQRVGLNGDIGEAGPAGDSDGGRGNADGGVVEGVTDDTDDEGSSNADGGASDADGLRALRREAVFLHTPNNNYAPYIMHCAEVAPSIALVVLSEGHNGHLSDLMHLALQSLYRIQELGQGFQRRQRSQDIASEIPDKIHMAIRGSTSQACGYVQINGNYYQLPDSINGRRAYQRTSMDLYLYYNAVLQSWCLGQELPDITGTNLERSGKLVDTSTLVAMVLDDAPEPENIRATWEVYDYDLREFHSDPNLQIRCVRGDGALRNHAGFWAKQSTNGLFYCGEPCPCVCGGCNGVCGPDDGCNCVPCKALDGSQGYGELELALLVQREEELLKSSAAESERALRKEAETLATIIRKICHVGSNLMSATLIDQLLRRIARLLETVQKKDSARRWITVTEIAEGLCKTLRTRVGEPIALSNQIANEAEEASVGAVKEHVAAVLKDYVDFLHVKIHRNVTMTAYLEMYPGLVHFIYVDRNNDTMIAPCLTPTGTGGNKNADGSIASGHTDTLKEKVWDMHAQAQRHLAQGYTSYTAKAGDFRYGFYLWFENELGEKLTPQRELGLVQDALDANFFRQLKIRLFPHMREGSVKCYELYVIHLARVPSDFAARQNEALVKELRLT